MRPDISLLDHIEIATPCTASWSAMKGDDRTRFCEQCSLHVYNISEMTRAEVENLIIQTEGRLCTRLYRRRDGTVITRDCPFALAAARRKLAIGLTWLGSVLVACVGFVFAFVGPPQIALALRDREPFLRICTWLTPPPPTFIVGALPALGEVTISPAYRSNLVKQAKRNQLTQLRSDYARTPSEVLKKQINLISKDLNEED